MGQCNARRRTRRVVFSAAVSVPCLVVAALAWVGVLGDNLRVVEAGQVYRSAQMSPSHLAVVLRSKGIRAVINLRGRAPGVAELGAERAVCERFGVAHRDITLSARQLPPQDELKRLLAALDSLPKPLLIHCYGGADRTGLACTLYQVVYRHLPLDVAEADQLTWRYGHLPFGPTQAMDRFFDRYRREGRGLDLREWIATRYTGDGR